MSAPSQSTHSKRSIIGLLPVSLFACWLISMIPQSVQSSARSLLLDATLPVQSVKNWTVDFQHQWTSTDQQAVLQLQQELQHQRDDYQLALRKKELQLISALNEKSDRQNAIQSSFNVLQDQSWVQTEVVRAEVLSVSQLKYLHRQLLIESSLDNKSQTDQLVLQASTKNRNPGEQIDSLIIDRGEFSGLGGSFPVFAGQCIVGSLTDVGRQISRVRLVTDPEYRGRARILRKLNEGLAYGPEGVLEGTGDELCKLRYIGKTESVRVGDEVYTADPTTSSSAPLYYGRVEKVDLQPNSHEWTVWVRPGFDLNELNTVQILKHSFTPKAPLAN
ncbi:MAG: rod shape-determining protein MreC [Planctomycetaceae bacterium]|nr:rod shape-determining protein MreC [Planctomycetaceae bacterium]